VKESHAEGSAGHVYAREKGRKRCLSGRKGKGCRKNKPNEEKKKSRAFFQKEKNKTQLFLSGLLRCAKHEGETRARAELYRLLRERTSTEKSQCHKWVFQSSYLKRAAGGLGN